MSRREALTPRTIAIESLGVGARDQAVAPMGNFTGNFRECVMAAFYGQIRRSGHRPKRKIAGGVAGAIIGTTVVGPQQSIIRSPEQASSAY